MAHISDYSSTSIDECTTTFQQQCATSVGIAPTLGYWACIFSVYSQKGCITRW